LDKKKLKKEINDFQPTYIEDKYKNLTFSIILIQPEHAGNIGSIARVMKNFNFRDLIIFNPIENEKKIMSYETQGFAMHGKDILLNAQIVNVSNQKNHFSDLNNLLREYDLIIATTSKGKHYRNIRRNAIFPEDFELPKSQNPLKIAILFGKESRGLTNKELELSDILLRIPTGEIYPALNISQACGIILYEIFKKLNKITLGRGFNPILIADKKDRIIFYQILKNLIKKLKIRTYKKENVFFAFKNIFERALIAKKELSLVMGVFSKLDSILHNSPPYEE
jgi:tRNA/rRNA methyltransferase